MQSSYCFVLLASIALASATPFARFINPLNEDLEIRTDQFKTMTLSQFGVSPYQAVPSGNLQVTNVLSNGNSLTNNNALQLNVEDSYVTFVAYLQNGTFYFIMYNETLDDSVTMAMHDSTMAFVRLLDLASGIAFLNLVGDGSPNSATLFQYIGQFQITAYKPVNVGFQSLLVTPSMTSESFVVPTQFSPGMGYTIIFYNNGTDFNGVQTFDRIISTQTSQPAGSSSSSSSSSTGAQPAGSSSSSSSGDQPSMSTSGSIIINNNENNSGARLGSAVALASIFALALVL